MNKLYITGIIVSCCLCFIGAMGQAYEFETPIRLSPNVNSEAEESMPFLSPDGNTLYFVRTFYELNTGGRLAGQDVWVSKKTKFGNWDIASNVIGNLNNEKNNAVIGVDQAHNTLYLFDSYGPITNKVKGIAYADKYGGSWSDPRSMHLNDINSQNSFLGFFMSKDGNVLLISMEAPGGFGQEDLYVCFKDNFGKWTDPENLGPTINTEGFEISPFLSDDGKVLFFASEGHNTLGSADIFVSKKQYDSWAVWTNPINLGKEVNSPGFDAYPYMYGQKELYFVSNRENKFSDIYMAKVSGIKMDRMRAELNTDKYKLTEQEIEALLGIPVSRNILFDFGSYEVSPEDQELIYFLANKIKDNLEYQVEIIGHTDREGSSEYNIDLSKSRANEVAKYFEEYGISFTRISTTGLGERKLLYESDDEDEASLNRRVEIFFVK